MTVDGRNAQTCSARTGVSSALAAVGLAALAAPGAFAEPPSAPALDGKAVIANADTFDRLVKLGAGPLGEADGIQLVTYLLADHTLTPDEEDLLAELNAAPGAVTVEADNKEPLNVSVTSEGRGVVDLFASKRNLNAYWMAGNDQMRKLWVFASCGPTAKARVEQFVASKLYPEAQHSTLQNGYSPFRDMMVDLMKTLPDFQAEAALNRTAKSASYNAAKLVDNALQDRLPDFTYDWIRPGPDQ
ncbi:MAG: hypothetical protein GC155_00385 [Alphaproteobacteria bacterium]|nr:hypothetical protein [Alphaproteobacteria bacterium]